MRRLLCAGPATEAAVRGMDEQQTECSDSGGGSQKYRRRWCSDSWSPRTTAAAATDELIVAPLAALIGLQARQGVSERACSSALGVAVEAGLVGGVAAEPSGLVAVPSGGSCGAARGRSLRRRLRWCATTGNGRRSSTDAQYEDDDISTAAAAPVRTAEGGAGEDGEENATIDLIQIPALASAATTAAAVPRRSWNYDENVEGEGGDGRVGGGGRWTRSCNRNIGGGVGGDHRLFLRLQTTNNEEITSEMGAAEAPVTAEEEEKNNSRNNRTRITANTTPTITATTTKAKATAGASTSTTPPSPVVNRINNQLLDSKLARTSCWTKPASGCVSSEKQRPLISNNVIKSGDHKHDCCWERPRQGPGRGWRRRWNPRTVTNQTETTRTAAGTTKVWTKAGTEPSSTVRLLTAAIVLFLANVNIPWAWADTSIGK